MYLKRFILFIVSVTACVFIFTNTCSFAANCSDDGDGFSTNILPCNNEEDKDLVDSDIWKVLLLIINVLTAGVGILAVGGVIYASILYASAGGSTDQVKKAKEIIVNIIIGIVAYALMYSFLNFIIPGGVFK